MPVQTVTIPKPAPAAQALRVVDAAELLTLQIPAREVWLGPWLTSQSLSMIYGWRGLGKTHVSLGLAYALACGGSLFNWTASQPRRVLFLDGEMPAAALQERLARLTESSPREAAPRALRFLTPDLQHHGMPNLCSPDGQRAIVEVIADAEVIIVDNIATLARGGRENETEGWQPVMAWALEQRAAGRSVVFVHHAGKDGRQRGTSAREDVLDTVIALRRPSDYEPKQGARFELHFEKARGLAGEAIEPFEASLHVDPDGRQHWQCKPVTAARSDRILELKELGMNQSEIAAELGVNRSTVCRALKQAAGVQHD